MTAKAALCLFLLEGRVLNVSNCFHEVGLTNVAREVPRLIEDEFGVEVSRVPMQGKNRYGSKTQNVNYRLNRTEANAEGIQKMKQYVAEQVSNRPAPRTKKEEKEAKIIEQIQLF